MKLVVGLGNPGPEYEKTRHNVGFLLVDLLANNFKLRWQTKPQGWIAQSKDKKVNFLKPRTFMNESGKAVAFFSKEWNLKSGDQLLVAVDDADIPVGELRLRAEGGDGGHRGLKSITQEIGTSEFVRLRIGIGRPQNKANSLKDFVLDSFSNAEQSLLKMALEQAQKLVETWIEKDLKSALEKYSQWVDRGVRK